MCASQTLHTEQFIAVIEGVQVFNDQTRAGAAIDSIEHDEFKGASDQRDGCRRVYSAAMLIPGCPLR